VFIPKVDPSLLYFLVGPFYFGGSLSARWRPCQVEWTWTSFCHFPGEKVLCAVSRIWVSFFGCCSLCLALLLTTFYPWSFRSRSFVASHFKYINILTFRKKVRAVAGAEFNFELCADCANHTLSNRAVSSLYQMHWKNLYFKIVYSSTVDIFMKTYQGW